MENKIKRNKAELRREMLAGGGGRLLNPVNETAFQIPRHCWLELLTFVEFFFFFL